MRNFFKDPAWPQLPRVISIDSDVQTVYLHPMPSVKIQKDSGLSAQEAFSRLSNLLENDKELRKLDPKYKCEFDAQSLSGRAEGGQFKANMKVAEKGTGSNVELVVDLPLKLALVKGLVQKTLEKKLDETLA